MHSTIKRSISAAAVAAMSGALLLAGTVPASAFDAGPLASVVNGTDPSWATGSNFDTVQLTAPAPCDAAATRHVTKIVAVTATNLADQPLADAWVGDNLYATSSVGLPGPLTVRSNNSWQGMADTFGQQLVPANYEFVLRCQNNLGSVIYEEWSGGVTFDSPTHWAPNALPDSRVATTTALTAAPQPVTAGENATLTATVSESAASDPTGNVEFFNGATSLGTAAVDPATGVATLVGPLAAGTYNFTATYAGDTTFQPSTGAATPGFVVSAAPAAATATTLTVTPTTGPAYQNVNLTGTVANTAAPAVIPVGSCSFLDGTVTLASATVDGSGACTFTSAAFAAGTHSFTAVFTPSDTTLFTGSSSPVVDATYDAASTVPDEQTIVVTVPAGELTIFTPYTPITPLDMGDMVLAPDGSSFSATAAFDKVTVTDTRAGNPGWTASLIRSEFVGATDTIPAMHSGFVNVTPSYITGNAIQTGDVLVNDIAANDPGYVAGPASFATTAAGNGTGTVDITADFVLVGVPTSTQAGLYTTTVTFTIA